MRTVATDIIMVIFLVGGGLLPLCFQLWVGCCKHIRHFHKGCNNTKCWYRCKKCPPLHSEQLEMRIALLEHNYPGEHRYIEFLKHQQQMYSDNPVLDRETDSEMIERLGREAKEKLRAARR